MFRYALIAVGCLLATSVWNVQPASAQKSRFLTVTVSEIGRPYTVIDGDCKFSRSRGLHIDPSKALDDAKTAAIVLLVKAGQELGAEAIVGMQVQTVQVPDQVGGKETLWNYQAQVCGTFVKFSSNVQASNK